MTNEIPFSKRAKRVRSELPEPVRDLYRKDHIPKDDRAFQLFICVCLANAIVIFVAISGLLTAEIYSSFRIGETPPFDLSFFDNGPEEAHAFISFVMMSVLIAVIPSLPATIFIHQMRKRQFSDFITFPALFLIANISFWLVLVLAFSNKTIDALTVDALLNPTWIIRFFTPVVFFIPSFLCYLIIAWCRGLKERFRNSEGNPFGETRNEKDYA